MKKSKYLAICVFMAQIFALNAQNLSKKISKGQDSETSQEADYLQNSKDRPNAQVAMSSTNYPVTAGDIYSLNFAVGSNIVSYSIPVDSTYKIRIANMGVINCEGLTYLQLKSQVESLVLKNYPMSGVQFILTAPSMFSITVSGEVEETMEYNAWALTRLSSIVTKSFTKYSSNRDIKIENQKGEVKSYDLYMSTRKGDLSQDPLLRPGDKIKIERVKRLVRIEGAVERPGIYELLDGENLKALIENYGNGFDSYADISRIELTRNNFTTNALEEKVYLDKTVLETDYELNNYDVIIIQRLSDMNPVVFLEGAIATEVDTELDASRKIPFQFIPGNDYAYFVRQNKSLFTSSSDLSNAYIIREGEKIYIDLTPMIYDSNNYTKIEMKPNDTLIIPFKQFFISVAGAVLKPGRYPYIPDRTWDYYIGLAGGFDMTKNYHDSIKIVDINGKRLSKKDVITPECTITAKTNSGIYYFNQYAPIVTTTLTAIVSAISITTYIESKK